MNILVAGDFHFGSAFAPWPTIVLANGNTVNPNKVQVYLNKCLATMIAEAKERKPDAIVLMGDLLDGVHPRATDLIAFRLDEQQEAAVVALSPLRDTTKKMYCIAGTSFHTGDGAQYESLIAKELDTVVNPETGAAVWQDLFMRVTKKDVVHFAHHVTFSRNPVVEPNGLWAALMSLRLEVSGKLPGNINVTGIVRAHRHRGITIRKNRLFAVALPPFQLKNSFANKAAPSSISEIGYAWLEVSDDKVNVDEVFFTLPGAHVEELCDK